MSSGFSTGKRGNRLAGVSFMLAFASPVAALLGYALLSLGAAASIVLYLGGLLSGMAAIVVGIVALVRSRRYEPQQAQRRLAIVGLVVGVVATVLLVFPGGFLFLVGFSCVVNHMCV
jgi:hypothetical protein